MPWPASIDGVSLKLRCIDWTIGLWLYWHIGAGSEKSSCSAQAIPIHSVIEIRACPAGNGNVGCNCFSQSYGKTVWGVDICFVNSAIWTGLGVIGNACGVHSVI
jgi:hypothetical protein